MRDEIVTLVSRFVDLVDSLLSSASEKRLWVESRTLGELYFRGGDFRRVLITLLPEGEKNANAMVKEYLIAFRTLGWIICEEKRFTNAKWINGKTIRVITVDKEKYTFLKNNFLDKERIKE